MLGAEICRALQEQIGDPPAASARRFGSPPRMISSSPGISDVAAVIHHTQIGRLTRFLAI
jgi:hypothetical protein